MHEIDMNVMAHFSLRDMWNLDTAARTGALIRQCVLAIENAITNSAPPDFPNRLQIDGYPEDERQKVEAAILEIESKLSKFFKQSDESGIWDAAVLASRASVQSELKFIENAWIFRPIRHLDHRAEVQLEYLKYRLAYLKSLGAETYGDERFSE